MLADCLWLRSPFARRSAEDERETCVLPMPVWSGTYESSGYDKQRRNLADKVEKAKVVVPRGPLFRVCGDVDVKRVITIKTRQTWSLVTAFRPSALFPSLRVICFFFGVVGVGQVPFNTGPPSEVKSKNTRSPRCTEAQKRRDFI